MFAASQPITLQHSLHLKADFMFETPKSRSAFNTASTITELSNPVKNRRLWNPGGRKDRAYPVNLARIAGTASQNHDLA